MGLRILQILLAAGNCVYGILLFGQYQNAFEMQKWPPAPDQLAVLLIALTVLPLAIVGLRFPLFAGIFEFACAFIGRQLAHNASPPALMNLAHDSMAIALAMLGLATLRGIIETTREAFAAPPGGDAHCEPQKHQSPRSAV